MKRGLSLAIIIIIFLYVKNRNLDDLLQYYSVEEDLYDV